jgi:hypothetical protein
MTHEHASEHENQNGNDVLGRWVKAILQVGLAGAGAYLIWFLAARVEGTVAETHRTLMQHTVATGALQQTIERQTDIQLQICIMQARTARVAPDVCFARSGNFQR